MYEPSPQPTSWTRLLVPVSEHIWPSVAHLLVFSLVYDKSTVRMITGETLTHLSLALLVLSAYSFFSLAAGLCLLLFFTRTCNARLVLFRRLGLHGPVAMVAYVPLRMDAGV